MGTSAGVDKTMVSIKVTAASVIITVETVTVTTVKDSAKVADPDSGLSEGEIAGVAIGAAVGGIVLLGIVGLILRSLMFKEAKPVFTCLEKAPAAKKDVSPA